jgi:hypothetical protein
MQIAKKDGSWKKLPHVEAREALIRDLNSAAWDPMANALSDLKTREFIVPGPSAGKDMLQSSRQLH